MSKSKRLTDAELESAKREWSQLTNRHNNLMSLAGSYRKAGKDEATAIADAQNYYRQIDGGKDHDSEVAEAFSKKYAEAWHKAAPRKDVYQSEKLAWKPTLTDKSKLLEEIEKQDKATTRQGGYKVLQGLFKNVGNGLVWVGKEKDTGWHWVPVDDLQQVKGTNFGELHYLATAVFGEKINEKRQEQFNEEGIKAKAYERTEENILQIAVVPMEFDAPIGETVDDVSALSDTERVALRDKIKLDTCKVLEQCGLHPTTVTFSGNKSCHCLFRLAHPITVEQWHEKEGLIKSAYARLGADPAMTSAMRMTRYPSGCPKWAADMGDAQRLMFYDDKAEIEFETFVEKITTEADKVCAVKATGVQVPMRLTKGKTETHWVYAPTMWDKFIDGLRVGLVYKRGHDETELLIHSEENGVYHTLPTLRMAHYIVRRAKEINYDAGCEFKNQKWGMLQADKNPMFLGNDRPLNLLQDGIFAVYAPFANGLLKITPDGTDFRENDYMGYDIPDNAPTLGREYEMVMGKSEFETFLEHACGSLENSPEWEKRKHAFETLIGYLVCRHKEAVNYLCVLTEETPTENDGGTGKSLIMKAVKYWRKRNLKDMKRVRTGSTSNVQFMWSAMREENAPEYFQLDDINKNFNLEELFTLATDDFEWERKGKDITHTPFAESPKIVIGTNYFPYMGGEAYKRRIRLFELSNHYNANVTPNGEFGHLLFDDWDESEWKRYDNFIVHCVQTYQQTYKAEQDASNTSASTKLISGLVPCTSQNIDEKTLERDLSDGVAGWCRDVVCCKSILNCRQYQEDMPESYVTYWRNHVAFNQNARPPEWSINIKKLMGKIQEYCKLTDGVHFFRPTPNNTTLKDKQYHVFYIYDNVLWDVVQKELQDGQKVNITTAESIANTATKAVPTTATEEKKDDDVDMNHPFFANAPKDEEPKKAEPQVVEHKTVDGGEAPF